MTRDYLIRMAHECGIHLGGPPLEPGLERFADLVAAAEREACAELCASDDSRSGEWLPETRVGIYFAELIRARGQK